MNSKEAKRFSILNLGIFILIIISLAAGCGTPGKNMPVTEGTAVMGADRVQLLNVQVESFYFKPSRIQVVVNQPVRLILKSGALIIPHNITLHAPEAGIDINRGIGPGKTVAIEFTPTKTGEYSFFCGKDGHAKKGMGGTLVVVPQ
jgi:uncharacterized cupredoxin-like copper-binding protein